MSLIWYDPESVIVRSGVSGVIEDMRANRQGQTWGRGRGLHNKPARRGVSRRSAAHSISDEPNLHIDLPSYLSTSSLYILVQPQAMQASPDCRRYAGRKHAKRKLTIEVATKRKGRSARDREQRLWRLTFVDQ